MARLDRDKQSLQKLEQAEECGSLESRIPRKSQAKQWSCFSIPCADVPPGDLQQGQDHRAGHSVEVQGGEHVRLCYCLLQPLVIVLCTHVLMFFDREKLFSKDFLLSNLVFPVEQ